MECFTFAFNTTKVGFREMEFFILGILSNISVNHQHTIQKRFSGLFVRRYGCMTPSNTEKLHGLPVVIKDLVIGFQKTLQQLSGYQTKFQPQAFSQWCL